MAAFSKTDPATTFLTGISREPRGSGDADPPDKPRLPERSKAEVGRTLILTLLSQSSAPMTREELAMRAELRQDWYDEVVGGLESEQLIEQSDSRFALTPHGWEAAKRARERLLSPW